MSMHRLSGCPGCAEPLEEGDRFCGVCGYAVTAPAPAGAADHPTIPLPTAPAGAAAGPDTGTATDSGTAAAGGATGVAGAAGTAAAPGAPHGNAAPAPAGGYGAPGPAPGWGSVAAAAPTLVGDPADWAAPPAERPGAAGAPHAGAPYAAVAYGEVPYGAPQATAGAPEPGHDLPGPGPGPGTPPEGTPWQPAEQHAGGAPEGPAARYDLPGAHAHPEGDPQGTGSGDGPAGAPASGAGIPYGATPAGAAEDGAAPEGVPGGAAQAQQPAAAGGRTCVACRAGHVDPDGYCEHCGHAQPRERDHLEEELGSVAAVSDRGLRHHRNEDSFAVAATALPDGSAATVAIVCDGVSSASRPDEASAAAAAAANEALLEALPRGAHPQEAMHDAILAAAAAVNALGPEIPGAQNAPACTLVGAVVSSGLLTIGWVGDSRAYWVPDDRAALPRRLTEDDSWAAQMVAAGLMGEAEAYADVRAHAITGWLGADAYDLEPHTAIFKPDHPGVVVVCTDGLWNYAESAREMAQVLPADAATRPLHSAQVLVGHALDGGGHDNVTVAIVPFAAQPEGEAGAAPGPEPSPRP
ncbi:hypothetical protein AMK16_15950 [Streptomyces sp. CB00455]|uniref:protein phosphatase 2C domain-containing protein n=1 Tax=Streptomyces sp. CB00455 TaxID=1703927 RepID=UPI000938CE72|nr:PP2C family serine/threonine-protein phosphatase [Streptomyces sp. CB00455]OKK19853.1 hypothetical protein AMK16_15950 [Streptomyces sp. CB00455]